MKITITAAGQQAAAELQKVAQSLSSVSKEATNVKATHASAAKEVEGLGKQFDQLAKHVAFMATGFQSFRAIFAGGLAAFGFEQILSQTTQWDTDLQHLSQVMNGNVEAASKWMAVGDAFSVPVNNMIVGMRTLSLHIDTGSKALRDMGIATEDSRGKLLPFDQILQEVTAHFQQNATATTIAGQAIELFGRGGTALLPVLTAHADTIKQITDEAQKLGLVINGSTLMSYRAMEAELGRAGEGFKALILTLGHGFLPALAAAGQAIFSLIEANIKPLEAALQNIVSFIIAFVTELTGQPFVLSKLSQSIASASQATGDYGTAAGGAANATKGLTDALNDQIKALDLQIKGLQEATNLENYQDTLRKLQEKATADKKKVDLDYATYQQDLLLGNQSQAMSVLDTLQTAQQTAADDQTSIQKAQDDETRRLRINSLNDEKATLQARIAAIQDAAAKGTAAIGGAMAQWPGLANDATNKMGTIAGINLANAGGLAGKNFADAIKNHDWAKLGGDIAGSILSGLSSEFGKDFKKALFGNAAVDNKGNIDWGKVLFGDFKFTGTAGSNTSPGPDLGGAIVGGQRKGGLLNQYAAGGLIPGPVGMPRLAIVHGGERYSGSPGSAAAAASSGARQVVQMTNHFTINDATDGEAVARIVSERLGWLLAT